MTSLSRRLLIVWLLCVVMATLAPFDFRPPQPTEGLRLFPYESGQLDPVHFILNMLLFVPLGALLHHQGKCRSNKMVSIVVFAGAAGLLISGTVEFIQRFLPNRGSSLSDLVANTTGSLMGVVADCTWGVALKTRLKRVRTRMSPVMLGSVIGSFMIVAILTSGVLQARTRLSNWSMDYPLLVGNERTGDRPWRGRVFSLTISDASTPEAIVRRFAAGESVMLPGSRIATFDFSGDAPYRDATGNLPDLNWTDFSRQHSSSGLTLTGVPWLRSAGPASRLVRRLQETNAFTLRIQCATDDANQEGPARIVSNSVSPYLRNFTFGQEHHDLVFRLRTPVTGFNGSRLVTIVPGVFSSNRRRDILVVYNGTTLLTAVAGTDQISQTELTPASSVALAIPALNVHADELRTYNLLYLAVLFLLPGVLLGFLGRTRFDRLLLGGVCLLATAVLLEGTLVLASGRAFEWGNVFVTGGIGAVVLTVVGATFFRPDPRPNSRCHSSVAVQID